MKKLIFVINNLETGGVQNSLLNLIKEIHEIYDITILTFFYKDSYKQLIPSNVKIITTKRSFAYLGMSQADTKYCYKRYISRAMWVIFAKLIGRSNVISLMSLGFPKIGGYDCAISYLHEGMQGSLYGGCNEFVLKNIDACKKIAWIHCDFNLCGANSARSKKIYKKFDKIVACSEGARESFVHCMPEYEHKSAVIRNCNNFLKIKELACSGKEYEHNYFNIVTVARLSEEKGIDRAIYAVKACIDRGFKVKYHIIGYGSQEKSLKKLVNDLNLNDDIIFYGKQPNPYGYMVNADLFVLPSYHEAAPMVFDEAASLGVPVLATKTTSTDEMIIKNHSGYVCENSKTGIVKMLLYILENKNELQIIKDYLDTRIFDNEEIIRNFIEII